MSTLSNLIFKNAAHKVSSPFGPRKVLNTSAGKTSSFHNGVDYSTNKKKIEQYAIAEGVVLSCGKDSKANGYALYVWINYPSLGVKMLHYHLDSYVVKAGQIVKKGTLIGYTGMTGKATGIHLHLGMKKSSGGDWMDAEKWSKEVLDKKKEEPKPTYKPGKYKVTMDLQRVRVGAGTKYKYKTYNQLSKYARNLIKELNGAGADGFVKGVVFEASEIIYNSDDGHHWGKCPSGYVAVDKCKTVQ